MSHQPDFQACCHNPDCGYCQGSGGYWLRLHPLHTLGTGASEEYDTVWDGDSPVHCRWMMDADDTVLFVDDVFFGRICPHVTPGYFTVLWQQYTSGHLCDSVVAARRLLTQIVLAHDEAVADFQGIFHGHTIAHWCVKRLTQERNR